MTEQLRLMEASQREASDVSWRLDEHTKHIGRHGIAQARARLAAARTPAGTGGAHAEATPQRHAA
ncbi:MAG: hypothetical protein ACKV2O_01940 [Acidimicrobiales bacterium]